MKQAVHKLNKSSDELKKRTVIAAPPMGSYTLVDRVAEGLRQRISAGELPVGERLPSGGELARQVGVSIAVVREALARLRTQGLIATRHGSGSVVISASDAKGFRVGERAVWDPEQLAQLFEFRIDVECAAAARAAELATRDDVARLRRALADIEREVATGEVGTDADLRFHLTIARASKNKYRVQLIEYLIGEVRAAIDIARRNSARTPGMSAGVQAEHEAIVAAIEAKSPAAAAQAVRSHLEGAAARLSLLLPGRPTPARRTRR